MIINSHTDTRSVARDFLISALRDRGTSTLDDFGEWWRHRRRVNCCQVVRKPIESLEAWCLDPTTGDVYHKSGKFFRVHGLGVTTNFGPTSSWQQPIINQPEVGLLGILTKKIDGILHTLVQAKIEPGNCNLLQISPTVQATRSNYTQVHGGKQPFYLEYFLDESRSRVIVDQLQSEQGSRFLRKRNRNMIVQVPESEPITVHEDFYWLTIGQLFSLLQVENLVNMDTRTVLSCVRFADTDDRLDDSRFCSNGFRDEIFASSLARENQSENTFDRLISWLTGLKNRYQLTTERIPLNQLTDWVHTGGEIRHREGKFFRLIGVSVLATSREVTAWEQPLIESQKGGIICFICQRRRGVLHFLVQGRVEPGNLDCVEMAPTIQCTPFNYQGDLAEKLPPFYELVRESSPEQIRYDVCQSEEGGRFYHDVNRYLVIEVDEARNLDLPPNYVWMTIRQIKEFLRFNNYLNIEARGLIACLRIGSPFLLGSL